MVIRLGQRLVPWLIRKNLKVVDIDIAGEDLERLRSIRGKRCLLLPSHSGGFEPYIIVHLSRLLRDDYNYLAAMEAFQRNPLLGWFMQRMGCYSIVRGTADRASFQMTRRLLAEGKRWLVIFPEGQTVWQNDTVIPFQEGVIQLAFKAYEDVAGSGPSGSLFCVPVSVKYVYLERMDDEIRESLARLESHLLAPGETPPENLTDRLRRVSEAVLAANEVKNRVKIEEGAGFDDRIQTMKEFIVCNIERQLGVTPRADQQLIDRIRACFNAADRIAAEPPQGTSYQQKLAVERQVTVRDLYDDLWRILQFVAIYEAYVRELMTVERFMDVLCLLEMEVFGKRRMWGPRKAIVRVGEPLDLRDHFAAYKTGKRAVIRKVSLSMESAVRDMLHSLSTEYSTPLPS